MKHNRGVGSQNGHQALFDHTVHLHGGDFGLITNLNNVMNFGKDRLNCSYDQSFWASDNVSSSGAYLRISTADTPATSFVSNNNKKGGKSVRCIMD